MNIVFLSAHTYVFDQPNGERKYIRQHLARLVANNNSCTLLCPLVGTAEGRVQALNQLIKEGFNVESTEDKYLYIDKIFGDKFNVITYTYKPAHKLLIYMRSINSSLRNKFNIKNGSNIQKNKKGIIHMFASAFKYGKGVNGKLALVKKWHYFFTVEPYIQHFISFYKRNNKTINPDYIFVDCQVELMQLAKDLQEATDEKRPKIIPIISTSIVTGFGPMAFHSLKQSIFDERAIRYLYTSMNGFIVLSKYLKDYMLKWGEPGINYYVIYPIFSDRNYHLEVDNISDYKSNKFVTLINATDFKGLPIFIALAKRFPLTNFLAVTSWGKISKEQHIELNSLGNVTIMNSVTPVDPIYEKTKVLLAPSLWDEAFGMVVVEAMLRGIPVLASNVGGLPEAKLGVGYLLPVVPYVGYSTNAPKQDIEPWHTALKEILSSADLYCKVSEESKIAAEIFVDKNKLSMLTNLFAETKIDAYHNKD